MEYSNKINDSKTVVLVDDGVASGATLIVSAQWIKKEERISIQKIDNVIPVAPKETASLLEKKCDQLEIITKLATSSFIVSVNITKTLCKIIIDMSLYLYL